MSSQSPLDWFAYTCMYICRNSVEHASAIVELQLRSIICVMYTRFTLVHHAHGAPIAVLHYGESAMTSTGDSPNNGERYVEWRRRIRGQISSTRRTTWFPFKRIPIRNANLANLFSSLGKPCEMLTGKNASAASSFCAYEITGPNNWAKRRCAASCEKKVNSGSQSQEVISGQPKGQMSHVVHSIHPFDHYLSLSRAESFC